VHVIRTLNEKSDAICDTVRGPSYGTTRIETIMRNFVIKSTFISTFSERKKKNYVTILCEK